MYAQERPFWYFCCALHLLRVLRSWEFAFSRAVSGGNTTLALGYGAGER